MFDSELAGKIITGLITAIVTLAVCLINNYFQSKRESANRDLLHQKQLDEIQSTYLAEIGEIKDDYTGQVGDLTTSIVEVKHSIDKLSSNTEHALDKLNMEIKTLSQKQDAYNNLQARTYSLEKDVAIHEESIKVANHRIDDLERVCAK